MFGYVGLGLTPIGKVKKATKVTTKVYKAARKGKSSKAITNGKRKLPKKEKPKVTKKPVKKATPVKKIKKGGNKPAPRVSRSAGKSSFTQVTSNGVLTTENVITKGAIAHFPMGNRYNQMNQPKNFDYQPVRNKAANISGREYSRHALDRMQDRGILPSVVENAIRYGNSRTSYNGTIRYSDNINNISIVTDNAGKVVTVRYGK